MQLSTTERQIVYAQSPFYQTLERAEKIIADGGLVKGIHFLFPIAENGSDLSVSTILSSNDWRDYTMPLRTYNGYEFRYLDSYVDGETGYINVDDIGTVEWRKVVSSGLKALFPTVVSAAGAPVAGNALGVSITLSDTISPLSVRPNLTYSYSAVSYVKYNAIYRNYMRSFYISDKDNLIPGYDFYIVGAAEKVEVDNHISTRWPTIDKCLSYDQIDTLMSEVLSWDLCDHLCKNLIIKLDYYEDFIFNWIAADHIYKKRASFVLIAASTIHDKSMTKETLDSYLKLVYENSCYEHDHIKKAVSWALREIGKTDFEYAEKVLLTAYDLLASGNKVQIWIAKDVIKELETVVKVKERKRLITSNSKMGRER